MRLAVIISLLVLLAGGGWYFWPKEKRMVLSPEAPYLTVVKPLGKYSFPRLRETVFPPDGIWAEGDKFYYWVWGKKVSGQIHIPTGSVPVGGWPVVVMIRGYVDREVYRPGIGTERAAAVFSQNGWLTLAPDFLGYGESDMPPSNVLEDRFFRPVEILQLIASLKNLPRVNPDKVAIWGHSNGGQIALSVLEISGQNYPTVLWAPVSKPFPYSILYYTDEHEDNGRALRRVVAGFEAVYDSDEFSIHKFYNWINSPVQIHQGTADESVPLRWSRDLEKNLKDREKDVKLFLYPGADHNLLPGWDLAVQRSLSWFKRN